MHNGLLRDFPVVKRDLALAVDPDLYPQIEGSTDSDTANPRAPAGWAPRWIAVLFIAGSACFLLAPIPAFLRLVGPAVDGAVFFAGSLLFTSAATLQWLETVNADRGPAQAAGQRLKVLTFEPRRIDWWSAGVQLLGTLFFNATTFRALQTGIESPSYDRLVWRPDALGSICFLISGYLAYVEVSGHLLGRPRRTLESAIATVNLLGVPGVRGVRRGVVRRPHDRRRAQPGRGEHLHRPRSAVLPHRRRPAAPRGARASATEA